MTDTRRGRPREPDAMPCKLHLRHHHGQREAWQIAADDADRSISDWIRLTLDRAAAPVVARLTTDRKPHGGR